MIDPRRTAIIAAAKREIGNLDPERYWLDVGIRPAPKPHEVGGQWCGAFTLAIYHQVGLARAVKWEVGRGFIFPQGLPVTKHPEPGDVLYKDAPFRHHGIVESLEGGLLTSIEGNTPGVARFSRPLPPGITFYSIAKFLGSSEPPSEPEPERHSAPTLPPIPDAQALGIDVSHHNPPGTINYRELARTHRFLIARATYGAKPDETFAEHVKRARDAGLTVGAYAFFRPGTSPAEHLEAFASVVEPAGFGPGWLAPALDIEQNETNDGAISADRYAPAEEICAVWAKVHGAALVYTNPAMWAQLGEPEWLRDHHLWISHYGVPEPHTPLGLSWVIWQHRVAAITGVSSARLDQNIARALPLVQAFEPPLIQPEIDWDTFVRDRDADVKESENQ